MSAFVWGTSPYSEGDVYTKLAAIRDVEVQITSQFVLGEPVWEHATTLVVGYGTENLAVDKVLPNTPYAARARFRDVFSQVGPWSDTAYHRTVKDRTAPAIPTGVAATSDGLGLHITWDSNSEPDLAYYQVRTSPSVDGAPSVWTVYDVRVNSFILPAVTGPYWVQVQAVDTSGNQSGWS